VGEVLKARRRMVHDNIYYSLAVRKVSFCRLIITSSTFRGTVPFWLKSNNILCILNSPKAVNQKNFCLIVETTQLLFSHITDAKCNFFFCLVIYPFPFASSGLLTLAD